MSLNPAHPSQFLETALIELIRRHAPEAEALGQLHPEWLQEVYARKWFLLFAPESLGGLEMNLIDAVRLEEALAWADGSLGWTITLCAGAAWFVGFLEPSLSAELFKESHTCICGSGAPGGTAEALDGGYLVNGSWKYASGTPHATAFTANCRMDDGSIRAFIFLPSEVDWQPVWKTMGMTATASHSFTIKDQWVSKSRAFQIAPEHAVLQQAIYQYPFGLFADVTLCANLMGMARHFLDLIEERAADLTQRFAGFAALSDQRSRAFVNARCEFYDAVESSWNFCYAGSVISELMELQTKKACHELVAACRALMQDLYPYCGLGAASRDSEINRVWRDFHIAGQHALFLRLAESASLAGRM